jgi:N-acetylglucosamine kinase-like BadF-type ATPase
MAAASASAAAAASSPSSAAAAGSGPAHVFLGVDGGGTKTIVSVLAPDRQVLGRGVGGCTNQNSVGKEAAFANLKQVGATGLRFRDARETMRGPNQAAPGLGLC